MAFRSPCQELHESRVPVDCFWFSDFDFREVGMCRIQEVVEFARDNDARNSQEQAPLFRDPIGADIAR